MRHRLALAALVLLETAALAAAWWQIPVPAPIDWGDPLGWLHRTDPETATLVVGRLLAIVVAGWLLTSTLLAIVAAAAAAAVHLPRHLRALLTLGGRAAPGAVRHLAQAAIAVSLVAATTRPAVAAPAPAAPPPARVVAAARPLVAPLAPIRDGRTPTTVAPAAAPAPPATILRLPLGEGHRVVTGESLWSIAEARLAAQHGPLDPAAVDRYWRALCDANRDRLASGDVNAILPGEDLDLPPVA